MNSRNDNQESPEITTQPFPNIRVVKARGDNCEVLAAKSIDAQTQEKLNARKFVAVFFAVVLIGFAVISLLPAVLFWNELQQQVDTPPLPRWMYLSAFGVVLHVFYGLFLYLIPDWSTLRVTSWFLLTSCCCYALLASGMAVGGSGGVIPRFLQLPDSLRLKGVVWLLALTCLHSLLGYLIFREAFFWRRTEQLWYELFGVARGAGDFEKANLS